MGLLTDKIVLIFFVYFISLDPSLIAFTAMHNFVFDDDHFTSIC